VKVPMVAILRLRCSFEPRHRGLDGDRRAEANGGAPAKRAETPWRTSDRGFLVREEWPPARGRKPRGGVAAEPVRGEAGLSQISPSRDRGRGE
jgi:hypothetical protein